VSVNRHRRDHMSLDDVWRAATPFLRIRKNDIHVPISFDYAERLLEEHPQAGGAWRHCCTTLAGKRSTRRTSFPKASARIGSSPTRRTRGSLNRLEIDAEKSPHTPHKSGAPDKRKVSRQAPWRIS
jgi:hypothetical protein